MIGYLPLAIISFLCPGKHPGSDSFLNDRTPVHAAEAPGAAVPAGCPIPLVSGASVGRAFFPAARSGKTSYALLQ